MTYRNTVFMIATAALLAACGDREKILVGDRVSLSEIIGEETETVSRDVPLRLPAAQLNASWTHRIGTPRYRTTHAQLSATPSLAWSADIGAGDSRKNRITADPVVADGRIFTLDAEARVAATGTDGAPLWSVDLTPASDKAGEGTGGGLAVSGGAVFVTSGFGTVSALDAATGEEIWQQKLGATGSSAPTVYGDLVYVLGGDATAWALDTSSGRIEWQLSNPGDVNNVLGGTAPAVNDKFVIFPYGDGTLHGTFRKGGLRLWTGFVSGSRRFDTIATVNDITGDPVISGNTVYVGSHAGRFVALDINTGKRKWSAEEGALSPALPVGNALFLINDVNQLVRLDARDGSRIWVQDLPNFVKFRQRRANEVYANLGPILAGGQLIVASNQDGLRFFDPASGAETARIDVPGGATTAPVVANGTLYVVGTKGQLHAFR